MKAYTIRKPHYELRNRFGAVHGVMQERAGGYVVVNMAGGEKAVAVESCARHLKGTGRGTANRAELEKLMAALGYLFGDRYPELMAVDIRGPGGHVRGWPGR